MDRQGVIGGRYSIWLMAASMAIALFVATQAIAANFRDCLC